jgi:hypothetical protein
MAGGGEFQGGTKRKRDATGKPSKPVATAGKGGGGGGGHKEPVTAKDKRVAAKVLPPLLLPLPSRPVVT